MGGARAVAVSVAVVVAHVDPHCDEGGLPQNFVGGNHEKMGYSVAENLETPLRASGHDAAQIVVDGQSVDSVCPELEAVLHLGGSGVDVELIFFGPINIQHWVQFHGDSGHSSDPGVNMGAIDGWVHVVDHSHNIILAVAALKIRKVVDN